MNTQLHSQSTRLQLADRLTDGLNFVLPSVLEASEPPEARGLARDEVRLMVSYDSTDDVHHAQFRDIGQFLNAGDVLVINTSGTLNAAVPAIRQDGKELTLHLSTRLPANLWIVEMRQSIDKATKPFYSAQAGDTFTLPAGGRATLLTPHRANQRQNTDTEDIRLWIATIEIPTHTTLQSYLAAHGAPIRYSYVKDSYPNNYYQTVYATEYGSAEMPSAGRAFTPELLTQLVAKGVHIAPLILHTGVASLEDHEPPYEEYYRVPVETARVVTQARQTNRRVIAVGTTVVRALETVTHENGETVAGSGWTQLVITPQRGIRAVDGMLTGLHEPKATHLAMLEALTDREHLRMAYEAALEKQYLWHEFGDLHLILP
ncbi:MAG: S-adenosylmethionine:tRNA ribosyltransferase-isomerase [Chloroflexota bacterium]